MQPHQTKPKKAVIYCRVSSASQALYGAGLSSQETRCREYASYRGYDVAQVFQDDMSGKFARRPAMQAMLAFLRANKSGCVAVVIDDISRLARGLEAHLELRQLISKAGGRLESPSIEFGEDSDSILIENMLATVAQHQREKNGEQTLNRMRSRMMDGYWVFCAPLGYTYEKKPGNGNILVRDEPVASIIAEGLEGYACGRFETRSELKRFLECRPHFPKARNGEVTFRTIDHLLTRPVYAGYLTHENWNQKMVEGRHEALISYETYSAIQARSTARAKAPARKDINADFPLRGFVCCGHCNKPMSAYWAKGRNGRYAYYECFQKGCEGYRKSIRRDVPEGDFEALLDDLQPSEELFRMAVEMFKDMWEAHVAGVKSLRASMAREITELEGKTAQILERIVEAGNAAVIAAYESKIEELDSRKRLLMEKQAVFPENPGEIKRVFRTAFEFLENPQKLWAFKHLKDKRAVLKLAFSAKPAYIRGEGFEPQKPSYPSRP